MVNTIDKEELKRKIDGGGDFLLVETLPEETFHHRHLPGATNLPLDERFDERISALLPDKNAEIIVYCSKPS